MTFDEAVEFILKLEGGESNHARDPGGFTRYGIAQSVYPNIDVEKLTLEEAKAIYRREYWDRVKIDRLPDALKLAVFDCAVNQGPGIAIRLLQGACGALPVDGRMGPKTLAAIAALPVEQVFLRFLALRLERYRKNPNFDVFGKGWTSRLQQISDRSLA